MTHINLEYLKNNLTERDVVSVYLQHPAPPTIVQSFVLLFVLACA
jgi:hypothetical protein